VKKYLVYLYNKYTGTYTFICNIEGHSYKSAVVNYMRGNKIIGNPVKVTITYMKELEKLGFDNRYISNLTDLVVLLEDNMEKETFWHIEREAIEGKRRDSMYV
jgi:hypothetical protein